MQYKNTIKVLPFNNGKTLYDASKIFKKLTLVYFMQIREKGFQD